MAPASILRSGLTLVGPGRAGMALARAWKRAGGVLEGIVGRTADSAQAAARELETTAHTAQTMASRCELLVLAVPDDRISAMAAELARSTRSRLAFHLSGALPAVALTPLAQGGAAVGSLHPLRAFTGRAEDDWRGALIAIEGDPRAVEAGERIAEALGGIGHRIRSESKPLYHAAATLAAGGTMALLSVAVRAAVGAGLPEGQARAALARLAADAAMATSSRSFPEAFTGPIARRDAETVRTHRSAAAGRADFQDLYRLLAREILSTTEGRGKEQEIRAILENAEGASPPATGAEREP